MCAFHKIRLEARFSDNEIFFFSQGKQKMYCLIVLNETPDHCISIFLPGKFLFHGATFNAIIYCQTLDRLREPNCRAPIFLHLKKNSLISLQVMTSPFKGGKTLVCGKTELKGDTFCKQSSTVFARPVFVIF